LVCSATPAMPPKRKREDENEDDRVSRPPAGTRTFETGQAVKEGLASGSRQGKSYRFITISRSAVDTSSFRRLLPTDSYISVEATAAYLAPDYHSDSALLGRLARLRGNTQCVDRGR
jgi:hypothetical protein